MSNLNLQGDPKVLFGNNLPTIFIDRVEIMNLNRAIQHGVLYDASETFATQVDMWPLYEMTLEHYESAGIDVGEVHESPEELREATRDKIDSGTGDYEVYHAHYSCYITFDKEKTREEISDILRFSLGEIHLFTVFNAYDGFNALLKQNKLPLYDVFKANYTPDFLKSAQEVLPPSIKERGSEAYREGFTGDNPTLSMVAPQIQHLQIFQALSQNKVGATEIPTNELEEWGFII